MVGYKVPGSHATLNSTEDLSKVVIVIHRILLGIKFNNTRYSEDTRTKIRTFLSFIFMVFERKKRKNRTLKLKISNCTNLLCFIFSIVLEDLLHPCEFFASHQYSPWWSAVKCFGDVCLGHRNPIFVPCDHGVWNTCCLAGQVRFSSTRNRLLSLRVDSKNWGRVL